MRTRTLKQFSAVVCSCVLAFASACGGGAGGGDDRGGGDTTRPTIISTSPANSATNVAINSTVSATFSETIDGTSVTTATFQVSGGAGQVSGSAGCAGAVATFSPSASLAYNTAYTATITTGVRDTAGNRMASSYAWSFTTEDNPLQPPSPPANVEASPGNAQNFLTWDSVAGATTYNLYWGTASGVTKSSGTKIADATSPYTHDSLTNGTTYYYVVTSVDAGGESSESAEVSAAPSANPPPPPPGRGF